MTALDRIAAAWRDGNICAADAIEQAALLLVLDEHSVADTAAWLRNVDERLFACFVDRGRNYPLSTEPSITVGKGAWRGQPPDAVIRAWRAWATEQLVPT